MKQGSLNYLPPLLKLVTLIVIALTGSLIASILTFAIAQPLFGVDISSLEEVYHNVSFLRALQIIQSVLVFILPSALAVHLLYHKNEQAIPGKGRFTIIFFIIAIVIIFFSQGFISWTGWLNHQLQLPESWQTITDWISSKEDEAMELTEVMLQTTNWPQTLITVFVIAVLPAIGEEWLFRGIIQRELTNVFRNIHIAIFVTAFVFSAIHIQFLTFLPRFVLGLMLGYLMVYSRNIWMPITAHFFNNFLAVVAYRYYETNGLEQEALDMPVDNPFGLSVVASFLLILGLIIITWRLGKMQLTSKVKM